MTSRHNLLALGLGLVLGLVLSIAPAHAGNRPSDGVMFQMLNGEVSRELNSLVADGGGLTLVTYDAGPGCGLVSTGAVYEMHCNAGAHFCGWNDGGCSSTIGSQAYGRPVAASTTSAPAPYFFMTQADTVNTTKLVCIAPASGNSTAQCALFRMR